jgi:5-formyltetrahydrofolate cyclo-ligase
LDILEPQATAPQLSPHDFDILLIPGVGFDSAGHRLGQGGGFYDWLLADLPSSTWRLGHAHQFQVLAQLPVEPHDEKVHAIVTPNGIIDITTG